jgi:hypothetical protein
MAYAVTPEAVGHDRYAQAGLDETECMFVIRGPQGEMWTYAALQEVAAGLRQYLAMTPHDHRLAGQEIRSEKVAVGQRMVMRQDHRIAFLHYFLAKKLIYRRAHNRDYGIEAAPGKATEQFPFTSEDELDRSGSAAAEGPAGVRGDSGRQAVEYANPDRPGRMFHGDVVQHRHRRVEFPFDPPAMREEA